MTALTWLAILLIGYTFFGYPLLVYLLSRPRRRATSPPPRDWSPKISVCMAVHDGRAHLPAKLDSLLTLDYPAELLEILVYADGCRDDSADLVREYAARDARVRLIESAERRGKPTALNQLAELATGEVLLLTDVRQPLVPESARALVRALAEPGVGCVSGNLELVGEHGAGLYWRYEKWIRAAEANLGSLVGVSGSIYAIRKRDFPVLPEDVVLDDMWVPLSVAMRQQRVTFSPEAIAVDRTFSDEKEFQRKVRTLGGNYQLLLRRPELLVPFVSPVWFQLASHKVLRLLCPWLLAVLFVASWAGATIMPPESLREQQFLLAMAVAQSVFYTLAVLGPRAGKLGAVARSFVVLNAAAVVGLWRFARGELRVTW